jgi:hypothetical protein
MNLSFDDQESFREATGSLRFNNPPSDSNSLEPTESSTTSMPRQPEERSDDICLDDPPSDPNTLQRMPSQERIEIT